MGQQQSRSTDVAAGKENGDPQRTVVSLKKQRLSSGGGNRATITRRETSDGAEALPAQPPPVAAAVLESPSYRIAREYISSKLPAPAPLRECEQRRQSKPSIVKPLNMRPDYGAVSMASGIRELTQNWIDRCKDLAPVALAADAQVRCIEWRPGGCSPDKSGPDGCSVLALVGEPQTTGRSVLLGHHATFLDSSGRVCFELVNYGTALSMDMLVLGSSGKRGSGSQAAGAFGDGMKTEANCLVAQGASLTIRTANASWEFRHQVLDDCSSPQLCVTSTAHQGSLPDTAVLVAGAKAEWFKPEDFLALQPSYERSLRMVPECEHQVSGIEVLTEQRFHGRVYVRGIFFQACTNLKGFGLNYLGGHATFPILGIGRDRSHLNLDKLIATLPPLVLHLADRPELQRRLLALLYDQLAASDGNNAVRYIWWYLGEPNSGKVFKYHQGLSATKDGLVQVFLERHSAAALPVGPGAKIESEGFLQCKAVQVSSDLLAVLQGSDKCPTEDKLLKAQVARLADASTDYDFSSPGGDFMYALHREILVCLAPHVNPSNLKFKQLEGNRRMVIPFELKAKTMFAVDVNALDADAVHGAAAKVGMAKACPATGCTCVRLALLHQMIEVAADRCKLGRAELHSAVMGRVLDAQALQGLPPPQRQAVEVIDLSMDDDSDAPGGSRRRGGGIGGGWGGDAEAQRMLAKLQATMASSHLEGTTECQRSGRGAPPQHEPSMCSDNLFRTQHKLASGRCSFEAGSFLYAPAAKSLRPPARGAKPQFDNLPTERQMLMVRRYWLLLHWLLRDAFGLVPRFYVFWHPLDSALAFNQGGALWFNAGHPRCEEVYRGSGVLAWAEETYLLCCHELAHNFELSHGTEFSDWMAKIALRARPAFERVRDAKGAGSLWDAVDRVSL